MNKGPSGQVFCHHTQLVKTVFAHGSCLIYRYKLMQNVSYMTVSSLHFNNALFIVFDIVVIIAQPIACFVLA